MKKSEIIIFDYFTSNVRVEEILKSKKKNSHKGTKSRRPSDTQH